MEGTIVDKNNKDRSHVCDVSAEVSQLMGYVKLAFGTIIEALRNFIKSITNSLGADPSGISRVIIRFAQEVQAGIKKLGMIMSEIQEVKNTILDVVAKARQMLDYILSLPEKTLVFIRSCTGTLIGSITAPLDDLVNIQGSIEGTEIEEVLEGLRGITEASIDVAGQALDIASSPIQAIDVFLSPSSSMSSSDVGGEIDNWINDSWGSYDQGLITSNGP
jgi:hypothetical protein